MAVKDKQTMRIKQLSARKTEMDGKVLNSKGSVADLNAKWKAAEKRTEDAAYERHGMQARLQQSQRGQVEVGLASKMRSISSARD